MVTTLKILFLSILILSVKSSDVHTDCDSPRILVGEPKMICSNAESSTLKCTCSKSVNLEPKTDEFWHLNQKICKESPQKLFFEHCSFDIIGGTVFMQLQMQNEQPITEISFKTGTFRKIEPEAFTFKQAEQVKLSFENTRIIELKVKYSRNISAFGDNVNDVLIKDSIVEDFSSDMFLGMNEQSTVQIENSNLNMASESKAESRVVKIKTMDFIDVRFEGTISKPFLNVELQNITFQNCTGIKLPLSNAIISIATQVLFRDSTLSLNSENAINATADEIIFEDCTFEQPQRKSLMGLTPSIDDESQLVMKNLLIIGPRKGLFQTKFLNVTLDNITLDSCLGGCSIFKHLSGGESASNHFRGQSILSGLTTDKIEALLKNHTYCMDGDTVKMAKELLCIPPMDGAATGVIIGTVLVFVIVLAILAILFYKWYSQDRIKREQLKRFDKRWRFAYPQTTQYKQPEIVHFDSEHNKYYSRPGSVVYMIDSQHPSFDSQGSNEDGRPDVVQDCMAINTINVEPESPEEEIVKESKFSFIRKKSVMIRNRLRRESSKDEEIKPTTFTTKEFDSDARNNVSSVIFYD